MAQDSPPVHYQSIGRAFREQLGIEIGKTDIVNDLILGQAARHVIVHNGALVDAKMLNQVRGAMPRTLKKQLAIGERLQFEPDEIRALGAQMAAYVQQLSGDVSRLVR